MPSWVSIFVFSSTCQSGIGDGTTFRVAAVSDLDQHSKVDVVGMYCNAGSFTFLRLLDLFTEKQVWPAIVSARHSEL